MTERICADCKWVRVNPTLDGIDAIKRAECAHPKLVQTDRVTGRPILQSCNAERFLTVWEAQALGNWGKKCGEKGKLFEPREGEGMD